MRRIAAVIRTASMGLLVGSCARTYPITQEELVRRTQRLVDAVSTGDRAPWQAYYADDCTYVDERGTVMNKQALLANVTPMPAGYSGTIRVSHASSRIVGAVAVLSYDLDEREAIFGQQLSARYHATDTWLRRHGQWQIIAGQVLRYYADPAPAAVDPGHEADYVGEYQLAPGITLVVSTDRSRLYLQRGDHPRELLVPEAAGVLFRKGVEGRILFHRGSDGRVDQLISRRNNEDVAWRRVK